ncbi:hypothetical protein PHLCEN_2v3167, partial [Hermanssonia centrifuga]
MASSTATPPSALAALPSQSKDSELLKTREEQRQSFIYLASTTENVVLELNRETVSLIPWACSIGANIHKLRKSGPSPAVQ